MILQAGRQARREEGYFDAFDGNFDEEKTKSKGDWQKSSSSSSFEEEGFVVVVVVLAAY